MFQLDIVADPLKKAAPTRITLQQGRASGRGAKQGDTAGDGRRREMCLQQRF
jgi:hypothetical protein